MNKWLIATIVLFVISIVCIICTDATGIQTKDSVLIFISMSGLYFTGLCGGIYQIKKEYDNKHKNNE